MSTITEPGLYEMTNPEYHAQPALSASGMKLLLDAPVKYKLQQEKPAHSGVFDFGSAWHAEVLEDSSVKTVVVQKLNKAKERVDADTYDTVSAKEHVEKIRAEGHIPILAKEQAKVRAMTEIFKADTEVQKYLRLDDGAIEQSAFWQDERTGVWLRARFDFLPNSHDGQDFNIVDPKTAASSEPYQWLRKAPDYGYHVQAALYLRAARALGLHPRPGFIFAVQEKTAPYIPTMIRLAPHSLAVGDYLINRAIDRYIECTKTGRWPGYAEELVHDDLPSYYLNRFEGMI